MNDVDQNPTNEIPTEETRVFQAKEILVLQYLESFVPAKSLTEKGAYLRSSEQICVDIAEMINIGVNELSMIMLCAGYRVTCNSENFYTPGWLMKRKEASDERN